MQAERPEWRLALNHLGLEVVKAQDHYRVIAVLDGYPAQEAGILRGDVILTVDGRPFHPVYSLNESDASPQQFTAKQQPVSVGLLRGAQELELMLTPVFENLFDSYRSATLHSVQEFAAGNKVIGYVRLWAISRSSHDLTVFRRLISDLSHCDGLIIDLRHSMGYLAPLHLDLVFPNRNRYPRLQGESKLLPAATASALDPNIRPYRKPLAVLINGATIGGAELYAQQLAKLPQTTLLGETSAGMLGNFQAIAGTASLRYVAGPELLIDDERLEGRGVTPDRIVQFPLTQTGPSDPQFEFAANILMGTI